MKDGLGVFVVIGRGNLRGVKTLLVRRMCLVGKRTQGVGETEDVSIGPEGIEVRVNEG